MLRSSRHPLAHRTLPPSPPAASGFRVFLPRLLPLLAELAGSPAGCSTDVLWLAREVLQDYAPEPLLLSQGGSAAALAPQLYALGARVLDAALAQLLRPDLGPPGGGGPARGTRAAAEDPAAFEAAFRLGSALLASFPDQFFVSGAPPVEAVGAAAGPLVCGSPLHALVAASLACLSFYDRHLTASVCVFLRAFINAALEMPTMPRRRSPYDDDGGGHGGAGGDIDADPRALERARRAERDAAAREAAAHEGRSSAASRDSAAETVSARDERLRRQSRVVASLSTRKLLPETALAVSGPNALVLPGAPGELLFQRLYKRLLVGALREFPLDAVDPRDHQASPAGALRMLERLVPEGTLTSQWVGEVLSDPAVLRPGLVEASRVSELAHAMLNLRLPGSLHAQAVLDLAEAVRGRDSGRPPVTPGSHNHAGGSPAPAARLGAAVEDDDDELD